MTISTRTISLICVLMSSMVHGLTELEEDGGLGTETYKIEGRVVRPDASLVASYEWFAGTKVFTNSGHYGFIREDGSFVINNVPWGSHVVQVMNPTFVYEPVRVDINSKGKMRARAVNNIQPSQVVQVPYPLRMKTVGGYRYFLQREQWRVTDIFMNPMVLMTVLPLALMMLLPRLNDPETRKEMESMQMPNVQTPELSEIMTNFFGGGASSSSGSSKKERPRTGKRKDKIN